MAEYEISILYDPGLEVDLSKAEERVKKIVADNKGKIVDADNWGKRKLAYPIANNEHAIYVFYTAELEPKVVGKVETALNITNEVIRYLIVRVDQAEKAKAELATKELAANKAKRPKQDEENESKED